MTNNYLWLAILAGVYYSTVIVEKIFGRENILRWLRGLVSNSTVRDFIVIPGIGAGSLQIAIYLTQMVSANIWKSDRPEGERVYEIAFACSGILMVALVVITMFLVAINLVYFRREVEPITN